MIFRIISRSGKKSPYICVCTYTVCIIYLSVLTLTLSPSTPAGPGKPSSPWKKKKSDDKSMNISGSNITLTQLLTGFSERFDMSWRQFCGRTAEPLTFSPGYPGGPGGPGGPWRNTDGWDKDVTITLNYNLLYGTSSPLKLLWHTLVNSTSSWYGQQNS